MNQKWIMERHRQHWTHKPHDEDRKKKHDTTQKAKEMRKQTLEKTTGQIQSEQS